MTTRCDLPPTLGKDKSRQSKRLSELEELISAALRAAHVARDKGFYTVSREATMCVDILRRIRCLPLKARVISASNGFPSLEFLAKNGNPKIRSEARNVLQHWRNILSGKPRDHASGSSCSTREADSKKKTPPLTKTSTRRTKRSEGLKPSKALKGIEDSVGSCLSREQSTNKKTSPSVDTQETTSSVGTTETQEVYETVKRTHEAVKDQTFLSPEASRRCVVALKGLFLVPQAVTRDLLLTTDAGLRMLALSKHSDPHVESMAETLYNHWRMLIHSRN